VGVTYKAQDRGENISNDNTRANNSFPACFNCCQYVLRRIDFFTLASLANYLSMRFWCDESIARKDNDKIECILDYAFSLADEVEFNILYEGDKELFRTIHSIQSDIIKRGQRFDKIYNGVEFIRFTLTDKVKTFVKANGLFGWTNSQLEDISFLRNGFEFLGTISHENFLILQMTDDQRRTFNDKGFNFVYDYGADTREEIHNAIDR
jgi:hypothetical protein